MAQDAGSIYSEVRVLLDKLKQDVKQVDAQFDSIVKSSETSGKSTAAAWTKSFNASSLAGVAAFTAIAKAAKSSISIFAQYQQSIANVASVSGATGEELRNLQKAAEEAGETTRFKASQAADALYYLASAGLDATKSAKALNGVLLLAGATQSDLAFSAQAVTATMSQFNIEAEDSARISNVFAAAIANSQATMDKLANSLNQVGPVAAGLNITLEETVGALQVLYNAGFKGEAAGRALKSALADLSNESSTTNQVLGDLGIAFEDINPAANSLEEIMTVLGESGLTTAQIMQAFGKVAGPQMVTLISKGGAAIKEYTKAVTDTNSAAEQYAIQNDTLAGDLDKFKSQLEALVISMVTGLEPALRAIVDIAKNFIAALNRIPGPIKAITAAAAALAGGIGGLNAALGLIGLTLTGPVGIVVGLAAATVALVGWINKAYEAREIKLEETFGDLADELNYAEEEASKFNKQAEQIGAALGRMNNATFEEMAQYVRDLASGLNVSEDTIVKIGLASEHVSDEMKEQLEKIRKIYAVANETSIQDEKRDLVNRRITESKEAAAEAAAKELELAQALIAAEEERRRGVIEDRKTAEELYNEEIDLIERKVALDLITNQEALDQKIAAENAYQEALLKIGYDGLKDRNGILEEGDRQLLASIERRKTLEEEAARAGLTESQQNIVDRIHNELLYEQAIEERTKRQKELEKAQTKFEADELQKRKDQVISYVEDVVGYFTTALGSIATIVENSYQRQIDAVNAELEATLAGIEERKNAELEAAGIIETTKVSSLQAQLAEAIAAGNAEQAAILEKKIEEQRIIDEYDAKKAAAEEAAAKKTAQLEYKSALITWKINKAIADMEAALAIAKAAASAPWPLNLPSIAFNTAIGALQVAAVRSAKPSPPALATGGVVLPASGGVPTIQAENGYAEFSMNAGPQGDAVVEAFASRIAEILGGQNGGNVVVNVYTPDEKFIAQYITNGSRGGEFTIDKRVLRDR